jgi:fatty-acid desaturase
MVYRHFRQNQGETPVKTELLSMSDPQKMNWPTTIVMALFHAGAIAALFMFNWRAFVAAVFLYWVATGLGISLGYHRLHTHRSYKVPLALEYFFALCGTLTLEGGPISWVATHRVHHQNSDGPGDPHSPRDGGWWAHAGWILLGETKHNNTRLMSKYAPDLAKDRFYIWLNNNHWIPMAALGLLLLAIGGLPMMLWGICMRVVFGLHATWLVNSATHMWGGRRFATRDDSRNNWWVALITFGEGWHNNHHAHPTSARHGLAWYEFDPSWITLKILKQFGIAKSIRVAKLTSALPEREAA